MLFCQVITNWRIEQEWENKRSDIRKDGQFTSTKLLENKYYAKNQQDNGFGNFRLYLKYKLEQQGKYFVKAPKDFASTQLCSICGHKNTALKGNVGIREWNCPFCGVHHDRDINSSFNLKQCGERYMKE